MDSFSYVMALKKVSKFQNRTFKIYCYCPLEKEFTYNPEFDNPLQVLTCIDLKYDKNGMACPELTKADKGYKENREEYKEEGWVWRCWVKVVDTAVVDLPLNKLRKESDGKPPNPQGAQNHFIYIEE